MAGHSKWANIKRKKDIVDKKRGNAFTKLSKAITMTVIEGNGNGNPDFNVKLRMAIDKAKAANMPKENIERAIQKGIGPGRDMLSEVVYEGFGPSGSALLIKVTTDNTNRTLAEIRVIIEKSGGKLASQGAVNYLFQHLAVTEIDKSTMGEEDVLQLAEDLAAEEVLEEDDIVRILFPYENLGKVKTISAEETYVPLAMPEVDGGAKEVITGIIERLEQHDDVDAVYVNVLLD